MTSIVINLMLSATRDESPKEVVVFLMKKKQSGGTSLTLKKRRG